MRCEGTFRKHALVSNRASHRSFDNSPSDLCSRPNLANCEEELIVQIEAGQPHF